MDPISLTPEHYGRDGLAHDVAAAVELAFPGASLLSAHDLAALDQFHTRGLAATQELAAAADLDADMRVLDLGAGLGGPARYLAATYRCSVLGIDSSASFVATAQYLTERAGLSDRVAFAVGDALALTVEDGSNDIVWMQHVAMNIPDRPALYREIRRVLRPGGRYVAYDVVAEGEGVQYPVPWATDASKSHLLTADETLAALRAAGLQAGWTRSDTAASLEWFASRRVPPSGIGLGLVLGLDAPQRIANLRDNLLAGRIGILAVIAERPA